MQQYRDTHRHYRWITTTSTRPLPDLHRSYLVGSLTTGAGMLSASELERFFPERKARVFVGTWNMCEHRFSTKVKVKAGETDKVSEDVDDFLLPETCELVHDIYAIGTQESCPNRSVCVCVWVYVWV